ncbi:hypothetical protein KFE98_01620 [bacterium SCSIO 12741]|nr:hypothetical protein KFE98_01620 [bacterium SCSIO 12741]
MIYDPFDVSLVANGSTDADLQFKCNVGEGFNLQFQTRTPGSPEGKVSFDRIPDASQTSPTVLINHEITDRASGENELLILVTSGGKVRGRRVVAYS